LSHFPSLLQSLGYLQSVAIKPKNFELHPALHFPQFTNWVTTLVPINMNKSHNATPIIIFIL